MTNYCTSAQVGERLLMETADLTTYATQLSSAITEAMGLVDTFLKPYTTVPLSVVDTMISAITADFAASIFKRRYIPNEVQMRGTLQPDGLNDVDATGYFAMGMSKIERYIKSYYQLAETLGNTVHNPDVYLSLVKQGLITPQEARKFMEAATAIATSKLETLTKTLNLTETQTVTKNLTNTENHIIEKTEILNKSRVQKRFVFTESNRDTNYNQSQEQGLAQDAEDNQESQLLDQGIYRG